MRLFSGLLDVVRGAWMYVGLDIIIIIHLGIHDLLKYTPVQK